MRRNWWYKAMCFMIRDSGRMYNSDVGDNAHLKLSENNINAGMYESDAQNRDIMMRPPYSPGGRLFRCYVSERPVWPVEWSCPERLV